MTISVHPSATLIEAGASPEVLELRRGLLREFVYEHLDLARAQCEMAMKYIELGDDVGLAYALRHFAGYAKTAVVTFNELASLRRADSE
jgi:hypothetical protein